MKNPWKSTPNRVKIETKNVKKSRESLQDDLGAARGAIFRLGSQHEAPTWTPKFIKNHKKMISKIGVFLYRRLGTQSTEKYTQNPSKIKPKLSRKRYQKKAQRKNAER